MNRQGAAHFLCAFLFSSRMCVGGEAEKTVLHRSRPIHWRGLVTCAHPVATPGLGFLTCTRGPTAFFIFLLGISD